MTDKEIEDFMLFFDNKVPDPTHYPKSFMYYVKLWKYYQSSRK